MNTLHELLYLALLREGIHFGVPKSLAMAHLPYTTNYLMGDMTPSNMRN
jgi:hypothetical protein